MRRIPTAHLLHGFLGVGKTTFARRLEARHDAVRFSPDSWMASLFGPDPPAADFRRCAQAIEQELRTVWTRLLELGVDVVLDYGFWTRAERDDIRSQVRALGACPRLYSLQAPEALARRRIALRNAARPDALQIAPATYDVLLRSFEPLQPDEAADVVG